MDKPYTEHPVFEQLLKYAEFYGNLAFSIIQFISMGTRSIMNIDTYVYLSIQETLKSIQDILIQGRINDAYTLLRKYYDAAIINIYTILYLDDNFSGENLIVEKIENWRNGKEQLPDIRTMNNFIQKSEKVSTIYRLLHKDERYSKLRERCNNHTHYNFYYNVVQNAHSGENGHRIRLMAASKRRNRTGKKIINQVAAMVVEERSRLCDSPVNWRR